MAQTQTVRQPPKPDTITLRISRYNPAHDSKRKFMEFVVSYRRWTTVLDVILDVKKHIDHSVAVRYSWQAGHVRLVRDDNQRQAETGVLYKDQRAGL